jgi:chromosome segregation ATPase
MDPEAAAEYQQIRQIQRETDAKIQNLSDVVLLLARTSSEHDEKFDKMVASVASLAETVNDHEQKFSRILDILTALAESDEELREADERMRQNLDRHDEQLGVLIRMMDEWVRRQPGAN